MSRGLTLEQMKLLADKGFSIDEAIAFAEMGSVKSKAAERTARWRARKNGSITKSVTSDGHCDASPPPIEDHTPPVSSNDETRPARKLKAEKAIPATKPDEIAAPVWRDFIGQRKTVFTETALAGIGREAEKAGWTLSAALAEAATRGWQSFKADWVAADPKKPPGSDGSYLDTLLAKTERIRA